MSGEQASQPRTQGGYRRAQRHIEAVADRLDECMTDQALSGQGWDHLGSLWGAAERAMSGAEDYAVWSEGGDEEEQERTAPAIREYLLTVAASLLDLSAHIEAMRRGKR